MDKQKYAYLALPVFVALVILYLCCFISPNDIPQIRSTIPMDKVVHFLMYVGLTASCFFAYFRFALYASTVQRGIALVYCMLIPILFGGAIEIIQAKYCPGRSGDWFDFLADSLGVVFVIPFALFYKRYLTKKYGNKK